MINLFIVIKFHGTSLHKQGLQGKAFSQGSRFMKKGLQAKRATAGQPLQARVTARVGQYRMYTPYMTVYLVMSDQITVTAKYKTQHIYFLGPKAHQLSIRLAGGF